MNGTLQYGVEGQDQITQQKSVNYGLHSKSNHLFVSTFIGPQPCSFINVLSMAASSYNGRV